MAHQFPGTRSTNATAQERINRYKATNKDVAEILEAVKWVGNQGSHADELNVADVFEGANILELALRLLFDKKDAALIGKVRQINKIVKLCTDNVTGLGKRSPGIWLQELTSNSNLYDYRIRIYVAGEIVLDLYPVDPAAIRA